MKTESAQPTPRATSVACHTSETVLGENESWQRSQPPYGRGRDAQMQVISFCYPRSGGRPGTDLGGEWRLAARAYYNHTCYQSLLPRLLDAHHVVDHGLAGLGR